MKKIISMILSAVLLMGCLAMASGCKTKDKTVKDEKTINVRVYKAGFGDLFIYDLKKNFEQVYEAEGYKVNIMTPSSSSSGTNMIQEMSRGYAKTQIDLYVTGAIMPNQVSAEMGEYGEVCEDLEQIVFNQKAIGYDGKESEKTISQMLSPDLVPFLRADNGTMYGVPWAQTSAGVAVNTKKLSAYGVTELPRTTDEMFEIFDMIYNGANGIKGSEESKTYPVTYNLSVDQGGASTYQNVAILNWLAQFDIDAYNQFLRMQTRSANGWVNMEDGYKVFENLSVGVNFSYLYGNITHSVATVFNNSNAFSSLRTDKIKVSDYKLDLGVQYTQDFGEKHKVNLGAVYSYGHDMHSTGYKYKQTFSSQTSSIQTQTVDSIQNAFSLPHTFGVGATYVYNNRLTVGLDYTLQKWADIKFFNQQGAFNDRKKISFGAEFVPNPTRRGYLNRIKYRIGAYYSDPYAKVNGNEGAREYGASFGFGFPIFRNKSILNISGQYIKVSPKFKGMLEENYLKVNIGLTFNERWFMKWRVE